MRGEDQWRGEVHSGIGRRGLVQPIDCDLEIDQWELLESRCSEDGGEPKGSVTLEENLRKYVRSPFTFHEIIWRSFRPYLKTAATGCSQEGPTACWKTGPSGPLAVGSGSSHRVSLRDKLGNVSHLQKYEEVVESGLRSYTRSLD